MTDRQTDRQTDIQTDRQTGQRSDRRANRFTNGHPKTVRPAIGPLPLSCLSVCLSVTLVYCGQTVAWMKMKLGTEVGIGPGHIVLDGEAAHPQRGTAPSGSPSNNVAWAEVYLRTKWHLNPSNRLATTDTGQNWGTVLSCRPIVFEISYCELFAERRKFFLSHVNLVPPLR